MASNKQNEEENKKTIRLRVKYDETSAKYASQFILNSSIDELFLDCSSGPLSDPNSGESLLPIHTRLAISYPAAKRLVALLQQSIQKREGTSASSNPQEGARLPSLDES